MHLTKEYHIFILFKIKNIIAFYFFKDFYIFAEE